MFDAWAKELYGTAKAHGFWEDHDEMPDKFKIHFYLSKVALVHSELSEALEQLRKPVDRENITEEFADAIIRILDLYEGMRVAGELGARSLDEWMVVKNEKNKARPYKHGKTA